MRDKVYCRRNNNDDLFFIRSNNENYYLFKQNRKSCVENRFETGLGIDEALDCGLKNPTLRKTAEKIKHYISKCEKENNMIFFEKRWRKPR